jgi:hypothetical protein
MAPDYTKPPYSDFAPPGTVKVSAAALEQARQFSKEIHEQGNLFFDNGDRIRPISDWVVSFEWAQSRSVRRQAAGPREELGPGLVISAHERSQFPPEVIQTAGDLEFAIKIPRWVWEKSESRLIDTDETVWWKVSLR